MPAKFLITLGIEFGPIVVFFVLATMRSFYAGVAGLLLATIVALVVAKVWFNRIPRFSLLVSAVTLLFGMTSLLSHNPYWVVFEYTIYNGGFAAAIFSSYLFFNAPLLKFFFDPVFALTDKGWHVLSLRWGFVFLLVALGNEIIWYFFDENVWVWYRMASALLLCVFGFSQFFLARQERLPEATKWGLRK